MAKRCKVCGKSSKALYQRSYPGAAEYVSPRCSDCYDGLEEAAKVSIVTDIAELRKPCEFVKKEDDVLGLSADLFSAMKEYRGQGLAANQIGVNRRIFVMHVENRTPVCIVNPKITKAKGWQESNEGCLSLPGVIVRVKRPLRICVKGVNQYWHEVSYKFEGIEARRACHEIDHLIGKLIIDYKQKGVR